MDVEMTGLIKNRVLDQTPRPEDITIVDTKIIVERKEGANGKAER